MIASTRGRLASVVSDTSRTPANFPRSWTASAPRARAWKHGLEFVPSVFARGGPASRLTTDATMRDDRTPR